MLTSPTRPLLAARDLELLTCGRAGTNAEGVWQPTIAGARRTSSSLVIASTMNKAKSVRWVMLLSKMGSPTW